MLIGPGGMEFPGLGGDTEYAGAAEDMPPAAPTPSGPSHVAGRELQAIQQRNALMRQESAQTQARVNLIVGGVIVTALGLGVWAFWKSRQ